MFLSAFVCIVYGLYMQTEQERDVLYTTPVFRSCGGQYFFTCEIYRIDVLIGRTIFSHALDNMPVSILNRETG
jgi:hypothetical protein